MLLRFYFEKNFAHDAIWIDEESMASGEFCDAKIHDGVIHGGNFLLGVREQLEVQAFLGAKPLVGIFILHADTDDDGVPLFVQRKVALEVVRLNCAAAGEVLGVKVEDHPLAFEIMEADRLGLLRVEREIGRLRADGRGFAIRAHTTESHTHPH